MTRPLPEPLPEPASSRRLYARRGATIALAALGLPVISWPAQASEALARQKNCLNCHGLDRKIVGPAFADIARRYAGQKDVAPRLADKIVKGGAGAWGPVAMPAHPKVSPEEALRLAQWALTVK